ncbi:phage holin family protein [Cytobacillus purgationiresistens]|uniref:Toxin secretion/phage lysis holin n=1 Tax=Cytobacillus purgationiresistens TaxID=863449 RepID=A0ABU0ACN3_9BACI|nr:holin family protein [Cytobacillus purgationiresistens]MDQ0269007.1 toxin secretion/phage lysis holin [Cytobacillus purgationiresistens]
MESVLKFTIACGGTAASYLFGGGTTLLQILLVFVILDYATGIIAGAYGSGLSSKVGFKGIAKKVMIFALVAVAHLIDTVLGDNHLIRDAVIFFYLANEVISIIENAGKIGLPVPSVITRAVEVLKSKSEHR